MATCKDVALRAKVSTATVSRVFNQRGNIRPETVQRVLRIAEELNYTPNPTARSLKTKSTRTIGLIIPNIENPFYIRLANALEHALRNNGCRLLISFQNHEVENDEALILKMMLENQVSGVIFSPRNTLNKELVDACRASKIKLLQLLTMAYEELDAIVMDDKYGMYLGTQNLLANGHRRILFAGNRERMEGVYRAYDEAGIPRSEAILYVYGPKDTMEITVPRLEALLREQKPTAVFVVTDFIGVAMLKAMKQLKLHFPEDISFLMYDDQTWSALMDVSVITHPLDMIADMACYRLVQAMDQSVVTSPMLSTVKPFLLERSSVVNLGE